jgi:pyruvate dehydrogenase complex dehydrogenase (E1) component
MPVLHRQIPLDQATAGMVLSDDLLDTHGNILVARNVTLTDSMLAALRRHQVDAVSVVSGMLTDDELAARRRHDAERLARLFRKPTDDIEEATGILAQYVRYYRLGGEEE